MRRRGNDVTANLTAKHLVQSGELCKMNSFRECVGLEDVNLVEIRGISIHSDGSAVYKCTFANLQVFSFRNELGCVYVR
jgi:hypothetical protein